MKKVLSVTLLFVSLASIAYLLYLMFVSVFMGNMLNVALLGYAIIATTFGGAFLSGELYE